MACILHKKTKLYCSKYEFFSDSSIVYMMYFVLIWLWPCEAKYIGRSRWRNLGFSWNAENCEKICVMFQQIMEYMQSKDILAGFYAVWKRWKYGVPEGSSTKTVVLENKIIIILFCVCSIRKFTKFSADLNIIQPGLHF